WVRFYQIGRKVFDREKVDFQALPQATESCIILIEKLLNSEQYFHAYFLLLAILPLNITSFPNRFEKLFNDFSKKRFNEINICELWVELSKVIHFNKPLKDETIQNLVTALIGAQAYRAKLPDIKKLQNVIFKVLKSLSNQIIPEKHRQTLHKFSNERFSTYLVETKKQYDSLLLEKKVIEHSINIDSSANFYLYMKCLSWEIRSNTNDALKTFLALLNPSVDLLDFNSLKHLGTELLKQIKTTDTCDKKRLIELFSAPSLLVLLGVEEFFTYFSEIIKPQNLILLSNDDSSIPTLEILIKVFSLDENILENANSIKNICTVVTDICKIDYESTSAPIKFIIDKHISVILTKLLSYNHFEMAFGLIWHLIKSDRTSTLRQINAEHFYASADFFLENKGFTKTKQILTHIQNKPIAAKNPKLHQAVLKKILASTELSQPIFLKWVFEIAEINPLDIVDSKIIEICFAHLDSLIAAGDNSHVSQLIDFLSSKKCDDQRIKQALFRLLGALLRKQSFLVWAKTLRQFSNILSTSSFFEKHLNSARLSVQKIMESTTPASKISSLKLVFAIAQLFRISDFALLNNMVVETNKIKDAPLHKAGWESLKHLAHQSKILWDGKNYVHDSWVIIFNWVCAQHSEDLFLFLEEGNFQITDLFRNAPIAQQQHVYKLLATNCLRIIKLNCVSKWSHSLAQLLKLRKQITETETDSLKNLDIDLINVCRIMNIPEHLLLAEQYLKRLLTVNADKQVILLFENFLEKLINKNSMNFELELVALNLCQHALDINISFNYLKFSQLFSKSAGLIELRMSACLLLLTIQQLENKSVKEVNLDQDVVHSIFDSLISRKLPLINSILFKAFALESCEKHYSKWFQSFQELIEQSMQIQATSNPNTFHEPIISYIHFLRRVKRSDQLNHTCFNKILFWNLALATKFGDYTSCKRNLRIIEDLVIKQFSQVEDLAKTSRTLTLYLNDSFYSKLTGLPSSYSQEFFFLLGLFLKDTSRLITSSRFTPLEKIERMDRFALLTSDAMDEDGFREHYYNCKELYRQGTSLKIWDYDTTYADKSFSLWIRHLSYSRSFNSILGDSSMVLTRLLLNRLESFKTISLA
ncbi:MAG: hypothetical protein H0U27_13490, partial [Nitrosopumilus sp.]|nr:hypothetical protein [Nitrosopumilus sp.]